MPVATVGFRSPTVAGVKFEELVSVSRVMAGVLRPNRSQQEVSFMFGMAFDRTHWGTFA